jgi:hypothetical protein
VDRHDWSNGWLAKQRRVSLRDIFGLPDFRFTALRAKSIGEPVQKTSPSPIRAMAFCDRFVAATPHAIAKRLGRGMVQCGEDLSF